MEACVKRQPFSSLTSVNKPLQMVALQISFSGSIRQGFSRALYQIHARMYDRSLLTLARGVERVFMTGLDRACYEADEV